MAKEVLIIGTSGSGKTTSLRNLAPEETFIVNVSGKSLPFKTAGYSLLNMTDNPTGNMVSTDDTARIAGAMKYVSDSRLEIKQMLIDDYNYTMQNEYMRRAKENGYGKFTDIGKAAYDILSTIRSLRDDLIVGVIMHTDTDTDSSGRRIVKAKTIGKMIDQYLTIEGMFATVLFSEVVATDAGMKYYFRTQTDGTNTAKSPIGMFEAPLIDNDLKFVFDRINHFYSN